MTRPWAAKLGFLGDQETKVPWSHLKETIQGRRIQELNGIAAKGLTG